MSLLYLESPSKELRQGEILEGLWEHRPTCPPCEQPDGSPIAYRSINYGRLMVVTQDCDLLTDFSLRNAAGFDPAKPVSNLLPHILFCGVYEESEIRPGIAGDIWRRIKQNQDERYHCFPGAPIENHLDNPLPFFCIDFKKILSFSTEELYRGINAGSIRRIAFLPFPYLSDFSHRFFSFHARVFLPD